MDPDSDDRLAEYIIAYDKYILTDTDMYMYENTQIHKTRIRRNSLCISCVYEKKG